MSRKNHKRTRQFTRLHLDKNFHVTQDNVPAAQSKFHRKFAAVSQAFANVTDSINESGKNHKSNAEKRRQFLDEVRYQLERRNVEQITSREWEEFEEMMKDSLGQNRDPDKEY